MSETTYFVDSKFSGLVPVNYSSETHKCRFSMDFNRISGLGLTFHKSQNSKNMTDSNATSGLASPKIFQKLKKSDGLKCIKWSRSNLIM